MCESGLNPKADNGIYGGLYQFSAGSWETTRIRMNLNPDPNLRFNAEEAIKTAAFKLAADGVYAWPHCH
ncbi:transglycosylase family protein [Patescibacteria group bacterium]|nr:transglycosylase family protein [Patescibacteria group bacterium]MCL5797432.1 transglycosylase family protein [Patescibacteria group bacterium]